MTTSLREEIANDLADAVASAARKLGVEVHDAADAAQRAAQRTGRAALHATHEFGEAVHDAARYGRRVNIKARREIRSHPLASVAVGAAIGAVMTLLLAPRR